MPIAIATLAAARPSSSITTLRVEPPRDDARRGGGVMTRIESLTRLRVEPAGLRLDRHKGFLRRFAGRDVDSKRERTVQQRKRPATVAELVARLVRNDLERADAEAVIVTCAF